MLFLIHKIECVCMLSRISHVLLIATLQTVAHQASLSVGFSRLEYCRGLLQGIFLTQGLNPCPMPLPRFRWVLYPVSHLKI